MRFEYEFYSDRSTQATVYSCFASKASITEPGTTVSRFIGRHEPGKKNSDVEKLAFYYCQISFFPPGLGVRFRSLKHLDINFCKLDSLSAEDLEGLEGLESIDLAGNKLSSLPCDLFEGFRKLKSINLRSNKLEFVSSKLLTPLLQNDLTLVDLRDNTKIDASYCRDDEHGLTLKQLMCQIDKKCKIPEGDPGFEIELFDEDFAGCFIDLWESQVFSDFTIVTQDSKEYPVHKAVLGVQSSVFLVALNIDMKEKRTSRIVIDDFNPEAVEQFLRFFYTGRIPDDLHAMELFAMAAKYDVPKLKTKCEQLVLRHLDHNNAYEIFSLGHVHSSADMKKKAFNMIKKSLPDQTLDDCLLDDIETLSAIVEAARDKARMDQDEDGY